jgi:hypothetical protein
MKYSMLKKCVKFQCYSIYNSHQAISMNSSNPRHEQTTSSAPIFSETKVWMGKYYRVEEKLFILTI